MTNIEWKTATCSDSIYTINFVRDGKSRFCTFFRPRIGMLKFKNETQ